MVALKNGVVQNKAGRPFDRSTGTWEKPDAAENPDVVKEDASNPNNQDTTTKKQPDAKTPNQNAENKPSNAETPKPNDEILKPPAGTLKPITIDFYIDGKQVHIPFDNVSHFNELRAQLASGTILNDDLITKMKPIFAEARW